MRNKKTIYTIAVILLAIINTGCIGVNKNFKNLRNKVLNSTNGNFEKTIEFSIGKSAFLFISKFMNADDKEKENIKDMLKEVSNISIGIYERNNNNDDFTVSKNLLRKISGNLEVEDWESIVKVNGKDETIGIYIKEDENEEIKDMFAVILSDEEMVMLKLNGNLNSLTDKVIEQQGFGTKVTNRK